MLFFPYFEDVSFSENELNTFLQSLYQIYLLMLVVASSWLILSPNIFPDHWKLSEKKLTKPGFLKENEKIQLKNAPRDIASLINSYNKMIDELEKSATYWQNTKRTSMARNGQTGGPRNQKPLDTHETHRSEFSKTVL